MDRDRLQVLANQLNDAQTDLTPEEFRNIGIDGSGYLTLVLAILDLYTMIDKKEDAKRKINAQEN